MGRTERVSLRTDDGKMIAGLWQNLPEPQGWVLLLHMRPETKESWSEFIEVLEKEGLAALAIDQRGHGESEGGPEGYKNFADDRGKIRDVKSAVEFIESRGGSSEKITLIGASIGANLAVQYMAEHLEFKKGVLISPGLNYRGVSAEDYIMRLNADQKLLLASSRDDERVPGNTEQAQKLNDLLPVDVEHELIVYERGGHGTEMLKNDELPNLEEAIISFIKK